MKRMWRFVVLCIIVLAVLGVVSIGVGLFTGASIDRIIEVVFGSRETMQMVFDMLREELTGII